MADALDPSDPRERAALENLEHDRRMVEKHIRRAIEEAVEMGMDLDAVREMVDDEIAMEKAAREGSS